MSGLRRLVLAQELEAEQAKHALENILEALKGNNDLLFSNGKVSVSLIFAVQYTILSLCPRLRL